MAEIKFKQKLIPLVLTAAVFISDQLSKALIVKRIPPFSIGASFLGDFLRIIHVSNPGIAFSVGGSLPSHIRAALFSVMPFFVILRGFIIYFRNKEF